MTRRLISWLIVFALLLQGVAPVSAAVSSHSQNQQHCSGHEAVAEDCACCTDEVVLNGGCGTQCSMMVAVSATTPTGAGTASLEHQGLIWVGALGPAHLPLNPPPIS